MSYHCIIHFMTELGSGRPRNPGLTPSRDNKCIFLSSRPDWVWGPTKRPIQMVERRGHKVH